MHVQCSTSLRVLQITLLSLLFSTAVHAGGTKIHKWVDDKGVTHYGDKIPAKDSHRDNTVLNKQGVVVKHNQISNINHNDVDQSLAEQKKRDRALRASYSNEQEIDLARDRSLQMDEVVIQSLEQRRASALKRQENNQKNIDGFVKQQKPVPEDLSQNKSEIKAEITSIDEQIAKRKSIMDETKKRFEEDKERFIEIKASQN
jgi:septal ring factor EnvC (AmiA/AmiB activator)